ncbi:MAG TPA: Gfo/Idh/MocA family oxidoreductase [Chthonomonadales bacterium]|nr:Gfo/Idh/MocA family oxidoreductase [Chthonomonadales bacterium]
MHRASVGIVGCGAISAIYFQRCAQFRNLRVVACADLAPERALDRAREFRVPKAVSVDDLLADPDIEIVLNLTVPKAHADVNLRAIDAGKHVYSEKPLATSRADGRRTIEAARARGVRVGSAPDTFLGAGIQTCIKAIDDGAIGWPLGATAFMLCHGHESWHPSPEFYYEVGGGPMLDMGPYYLTALVSMLGPVEAVSASARTTFPERTITSQPKAGKVVTVETPTHIAGVLDFASGAVGTIVTSFDVWAANVPCLEVYGTEGTISCPDPNSFGGTVRVRRPGDSAWREAIHAHGFGDNYRGVGVADMAAGIAAGRSHRASGDLALHVLDIMDGFLDSAREGRRWAMETTVERPAPLPVGLPADSVD